MATSLPATRRSGRHRADSPHPRRPGRWCPPSRRHPLRRCRLDVLDEHAGVDREADRARELGVDRRAADAEISAIDAAVATSWRTTSLTVFDGTAKAMPTLPVEPWAGEICELTPITWPSALKSGPPELPLLTCGVRLDHVVDRCDRRGP